jgi:hypothetical protein
MAQQMALQKIGFITIVTQKSFIDLGYPFVLSLLIRLFGTSIIVYQLFNYLCWFLAVVFIYKALLLITNTRRAFWGSFLMACSPIYLTFSAKLYSEPFASLGFAMVIYFLIKYKLRKNYLSILCVLVGMVIFSFTKSVYAFLAIPIFYFSLTKRNVWEYLILIISVCLLVTRLYFSIVGGRSDYNLAIQVSKIYQPYSTIGACSVYYMSYPVGKFVFPKFEGACHQNDPQPYMPKYTQNPYINAEKIRSNFNFGKWLLIVLSNPIKYFVVMLSSLTSIVFIEGFYENITEHFGSVLAIIFFATTKLFFAFYIWSNVLKNFRMFLKKGPIRALLSVVPLIYFFAIVGNYPPEQRYFFPLMPWVYFYASFDQKAVKNLCNIFLNNRNI